ncbi:hypothetical protein FACS1894122_08900 [Alphaproteobacteria bacterium]|nr:hypothetical protein FACS1894122_08900 [Alphaproteobacteria bacterium]
MAAGAKDFMTMPVISVIIPAKNASRYIREAIESIQKQDCSESIEIIVVDDASTDDTASIAKEIGCQVITIPPSGAPKARNIGLKYARGTFVLFHDADDVLTPRAVNIMLDPLMLSLPISKVEVVSAKVNARVADTKADTGFNVTLALGMRQDFISPELTEEERSGIVLNPEPYFGALAGCALIRRDVFDIVGCFDETLQAGEALEWQMRLQAHGICVQKIQQVTVKRRLHKNNFGIINREQEYKDYATILRQKIKGQRDIGSVTDSLPSQTYASSIFNVGSTSTLQLQPTYHEISGEIISESSVTLVQIATTPRINIAFGFDNNFFMPAAVAITSLLSSAKEICHYDIYCIVENDVSDENKNHLRSIIETFSPNSTISFVSPGNMFGNAITTKNFTSTAMYFRLFLPSALPHLDKILYLDTDIIVLDNLLDLYNLDFADSLIKGFRDPVNVYLKWRVWGFSRYFLPLKRGEYVNSGVLLMNLKKIREADLEQTWIKLSQDERLKHPDQDILNHTCMDRISFFQMKYNFCPAWRTVFPEMLKEELITPEECAEAENNPAICHYITHKKPWLYECAGSKIWWKYAKMTKFYDVLFKNYIDTRPFRNEVHQVAKQSDLPQRPLEVF